MQVKIKYHADIEPLDRISQGDWIDLRVAEDIFIPEGEYGLVNLGVSMELPKGYEAHIMSRSSMFKNFGLIMACSGIIDNSYCGDNDIWRFGVVCLVGHDEVVKNKTENGVWTRELEKGTMLHKNDRICQFRIIKNMEDVEFISVDKLNNDDRGGFGTTGKN